jgi:acetyltransferase-like isoleucine patch superfamily enzyme
MGGANLTPEQTTFLEQLRGTLQSLRDEQRTDFNRCTQLGDLLDDRWYKARYLGFGEGSSIYDASLVIGSVSVGNKCWIGPYTVLDGSGSLEIGDFVTISSGVHIYTHDNIKQTLTSGAQPIARKPVRILNNVYIGANSIINKGLTIHHHCVVAANSFVNTDVEPYSIVGGTPARKIGQVVIDGNDVNFCYDNRV